MQYAYYSKNTLAILFNETLKQNPDKKEFLMALWQNIKDSASECDEKCENCIAANHCMMIGDAWGLYKKYHSTQDTDQYWSDVVHESERIYEKYKKHRFAKKMLADVLEELSECEKERQAKQKGE